LPTATMFPETPLSRRKPGELLNCSLQCRSAHRPAAGGGRAANVGYGGEVYRVSAANMPPAALALAFALRPFLAACGLPIWSRHPRTLLTEKFAVGTHCNTL